MSMTRRGFLAACIATATAPAIVKASSLMQIQPQGLILWGDGIHDDTRAVQALMDGRLTVWTPTGLLVKDRVADQTFRITKALTIGVNRRKALLPFHGCHFMTHDITPGQPALRVYGPVEIPINGLYLHP